MQSSRDVNDNYHQSKTCDLAALAILISIVMQHDLRHFTVMQSNATAILSGKTIALVWQKNGKTDFIFSCNLCRDHPELSRYATTRTHCLFAHASHTINFIENTASLCVCLWL